MPMLHFIHIHYVRFLWNWWRRMSHECIADFVDDDDDNSIDAVADDDDDDDNNVNVSVMILLQKNLCEVATSWFRWCWTTFHWLCRYDDWLVKQRKVVCSCCSVTYCCWANIFFWTDSLGDIWKIIYLGFGKSQRGVTHDSLRYINILTYLLTYFCEIVTTLVQTCAFYLIYSWPLYC